MVLVIDGIVGHGIVIHYLISVFEKLHIQGFELGPIAQQIIVPYHSYTGSTKHRKNLIMGNDLILI